MKIWATTTVFKRLIQASNRHAGPPTAIEVASIKEEDRLAPILPWCSGVRLLSTAPIFSQYPDKRLLSRRAV